MSTLQLIGAGFASVINIKILLMMFAGVIIGIVFGAIPGLTAGMAVALCLPLTFGMLPIEGIALLCALYVGGISGGLITAILVKIPGTPASIATTYDGYPLARRGEAGKAIGVGVVFSAMGTFLSILALMFVAPLLAKVTLKFGPIEYFGLTVFALTMVASLSGKSLLKGLMSAGIGMAIGLVGQAPVDSTLRFTFGQTALNGGFALLAVCIGMFAIPELLSFSKEKDTSRLKQDDFADCKIKGFGFSLKEFVSQIGNFFRAATIGLGIGILPGIGSSVSNLVAYSNVRNASKYPEKFGTGVIDGIVASEASNNATIGGAMLALLTLGIPGDTVTALMLGGFMIHGISPGPNLFTTSGVFVYGIFAALAISTILMLLVELKGINIFVKVLQIPQYIFLPIIIVMCCVGAFGVNNRVFDVISFAFFGLVGYLMGYLELPVTPVILGFILGPNFELYFRRGMQLTQYNFAEFFTHPISTAFIVIAVVSAIITIRKNTKVNKQIENADNSN